MSTNTNPIHWRKHQTSALILIALLAWFLLLLVLPLVTDINHFALLLDPESSAIALPAVTGSSSWTTASARRTSSRSASASPPG